MARYNRFHRWEYPRCHRKSSSSSAVIYTAPGRVIHANSTALNGVSKPILIYPGMSCHDPINPAFGLLAFQLGRFFHSGMGEYPHCKLPFPHPRVMRSIAACGSALLTDCLIHKLRQLTSQKLLNCRHQWFTNEAGVRVSVSLTVIRSE